jgi:hypothetical protein
MFQNNFLWKLINTEPNIPDLFLEEQGNQDVPEQKEMRTGTTINYGTITTTTSYGTITTAARE